VITAAHTLWYSKNPEADRAFLRDVIGLRAIDIGHGWMIFAMPPSEAAVHPADQENGARHDHPMLAAHVYFMCDDLDATLAELGKKGVTFADPQRQPWGIVSRLRLPSGGEIGIYQALHKTAI
jgi:catechol 2,3-dioxygenase-like lactoylglutathione lyase family enzyme